MCLIFKSLKPSPVPTSTITLYKVYETTPYSRSTQAWAKRAGKDLLLGELRSPYYSGFKNGVISHAGTYEASIPTTYTLTEDTFDLDQVIDIAGFHCLVKLEDAKLFANAFRRTCEYGQTNPVILELQVNPEDIRAVGTTPIRTAPDYTHELTTYVVSRFTVTKEALRKLKVIK